MVDVAAEVPEETKMCPLCEQMIALSKFRMHDIGCSRANYKCKECGMCVPKAEREDHEEEEHAMITCQYCSFSATKFKYKDHEANCTFKPKCCPYCDQEIKFADWDDHLKMCGVKTYQCSVCNGWVKNQDKATHLSSQGCQRNQDRTKKEEDDKQKAELERFQQERQKEIEQKKKLEERKQAEEALRQKKKAEREKYMEQTHGVDEFDEFEGVNRYPPNYSKPLPTHNNQSNMPPQQRQNHPGAAKMPNPSSNSTQRVNAIRGNVNKPLAADGASNRNRLGSRGGQASNSNNQQIRNGPTGPSPNQNRPINYNQRQAEPSMPSQQVQKSNKPSIKSTITNKIGNIASKISPKNKNKQAVKVPSRAPVPNQQIQANSNQASQRSRGQAPNIPQSSLANPSAQGGFSKEEEINAALIQQMMEEDENEMLAHQMQNEAFGGGGAGGGGQQRQGASDFGNDPNNGVRQADEAQEECLIGGPEMFRAPRAHRRHRHEQAQPQPQPAPGRNAQDQEITAMEAELDQMQRNHSQLAFDNAVPHHQPAMPNHPNAAQFGGGGGGGEPFGTEQAMINKVIEDSLKSQQHKPSADYDEEAELRRILEASKNDT